MKNFRSMKNKFFQRILKIKGSLCRIFTLMKSWDRASKAILGRFRLNRSSNEGISQGYSQQRLQFTKIE